MRDYVQWAKFKVTVRSFSNKIEQVVVEAKNSGMAGFLGMRKSSFDSCCVDKVEELR